MIPNRAKPIRLSEFVRPFAVMLVSVAAIASAAAGIMALGVRWVGASGSVVSVTSTAAASGWAAGQLPGAVNLTTAATPSCPAADAARAGAATYSVGHDAIPTVTALQEVGAQLTCWSLQDDPLTGSSSLTAQYAAAGSSNGQILTAYAQWLQYNAGFTAGPFDFSAVAAGGDLWRNSVDAGSFLVVDLSYDAVGFSVRLTRGGPASLPAGVWSARLTDAGENLQVGLGVLSLAVGPTWARYAVQSPAGHCLRYSDYGYAGSFGGTLLITDQWSGDVPVGLSHQAYAEWVVSQATALSPPDGLSGPTASTIGGLPALTSSFERADTTFQYTVIFGQVGTYVVAADWWTGTNSGRVIQAMIDSIRVSY